MSQAEIDTVIKLTNRLTMARRLVLELKEEGLVIENPNINNSVILADKAIVNLRNSLYELQAQFMKEDE